MKFERTAVLAALAGLALTTPAHPEGLEAQPVVAGMTMTCQDFRGIAVGTMDVSDLGDVGGARIIGRMPVIVLDRSRLAQLPDKLQLFFYGHECAHHVLGHAFAQTVWSEREADCWAVKHGRERGWFTREEVAAWSPQFAHSKGSPIGHLPGPERAERLVACYDDPSDELVDPRATSPIIRSASTGG